MTMPAHPDTISGLAPDCRRILREEYQKIQAACQTTAGDGIGYDNTRSVEWNSHSARSKRQEEGRTRRQEAINSAIAEYRRVANLWNILL